MIKKKSMGIEILINLGINQKKVNSNQLILKKYKEIRSIQVKKNKLLNNKRY